jgi:cysteine desulfurase
MIYFDNSATTKPYKEVIDSFVKVSTDYFGNPSSLHRLGGLAEQLLLQARKQVAQFLNVKPSEILFSSGGTEGNNLAIKGSAMMYRSRGKHLITTKVEHASVKEAMEQLKEWGFEITYLPVNQDGRVVVEDVEKAIRSDTILVSIIHVNNEVGTIQPVQEIGHLLKNYPKILFHVDYVQGVGKVPLDLYDFGIDLCTISGHKFHGLKGTGALFIREGLQISPLFSGGNQEGKIRSGTENVAGMVAMAKALRLSMEHQENNLETMIQMMDYLRRNLEELPQITIHSPKIGCAPHILNFSIKGLKGEVFVHALEEKGIFVSTTSACSSKTTTVSQTLLSMGTPTDMAKGSIRVSLSYENTMEEAQFVVKAIKDMINHLGEVINRYEI